MERSNLELVRWKDQGMENFSRHVFPLFKRRAGICQRKHLDAFESKYVVCSNLILQNCGDISDQIYQTSNRPKLYQLHQLANEIFNGRAGICQRKHWKPLKNVICCNLCKLWGHFGSHISNLY